MVDRADCVFNSLQPSQDNVSVVVDSSRAFYQSCVFRDLMELERMESIEPKSWRILVGALFVWGANSTVALSNCTLPELYEDALISVNRDAQVYSDNASHEVRLHHTLSALELLALSTLPDHSIRNVFESSKLGHSLFLSVSPCRLDYRTLLGPST